MRDARDIVIKPIVSEKSYDQIGKNKYTFQVDRRATKPDIRQAIEEIFKVDVVDVNTINYRGKRKRLRWAYGYRSSWKKAVVTLKEGQKIEIFEGAS